MAVEVLELAKWAMRARPPKYRIGLGKGYYSMYHALRAVVFYEVKGDDHEAHTELSQKFPAQFPNRAYWANEIKNARLHRNEADYDPYPFGDTQFKATALATVKSAEDFLQVTKNYLHLKGCPV
jgi:uncharacterized protein (UPF0332 family)